MLCLELLELLHVMGEKAAEGGTLGFSPFVCNLLRVLSSSVDRERLAGILYYCYNGYYIIKTCKQ